MNYNELMVGDWVKIEDQEEDPLYNKGWLTTQVYDADDLSGIINEGWRPIPITPEILEKNGFIGNEDSYRCKLFNKDSKVIIEYCDLYLDIRMTNPVKVLMIPCMYIHELQHAIKLCGINKEIIS